MNTLNLIRLIAFKLALLGGGAMGWAFCSAAMRQAQPTARVSTATPPTTASHRRRYRRREKISNTAMPHALVLQPMQLAQARPEPPRKGLPAALAASPFPQRAAMREKGEGA